MREHWRRWGVIAVLLLPLVGCAPRFQPPGPEQAPPRIMADAFVMPDGARLPMRVWKPEATASGRPEAILVALHGFNDYSRAFKASGRWWADHGVLTYAYDQRGFGQTETAGFWPTGTALARDLRTVLRLLHKRHGDVPIFVLGESMGGAVAITGLAGEKGKTPAKGVILAAPAVWGWSTMNPFYRIALWWGAHLFPGMTVTGESLDIRPSDNIAMLRQLAKDPLVIKETRVDAIYGLVNLMETASEAATRLKLPTLLLYGGKDAVIPDHAVKRVRSRLADSADSEIIVYENGYHMLLRDCQAPRVWSDILAWIADHGGNGNAESVADTVLEIQRHPLCRGQITQ